MYLLEILLFSTFFQKFYNLEDQLKPHFYVTVPYSYGIVSSAICIWDSPVCVLDSLIRMAYVYGTISVVIYN